MDDIDYYTILAGFKLAIVIEQGFQRAGGNTVLRNFGRAAIELMQRAADRAERTDYRVVAGAR